MPRVPKDAGTPLKCLLSTSAPTVYLEAEQSDTEIHPNPFHPP